MFFKSEDNGNSQPKWKWVVNVLEKKKLEQKITIHKYKM